jgi:hypothetical protein
MSYPAIPLDHDALSELLNDPAMIRIVTVVNLASLSILELLEYGFTRKDVNRAMAKGVIEFDKPSVPSMPETMSRGDIVHHVLETGDYYFGMLSSKVKLTRLGLYMLEIIEGEVQSARAEGGLEEPEEQERTFSKPAPQLQNDS